MELSMANDELWAVSDEIKWNPPKKSLNAVHLSMLFAAGVVAVAVVITPILAEKTDWTVANSGGQIFDNVVTGSVGSTSDGIQKNPFSGKKQYTIRRSITQTSVEECVIYDNGARTAGC
jgi:hypothetical protein